MVHYQRNKRRRALLHRRSKKIKRSSRRRQTSRVRSLSELNGETVIRKTVSDLRIQRNYLVQSVKQYQFVYRAIMEWS